MTQSLTVRHPIEWVRDILVLAFTRHQPVAVDPDTIIVNRIGVADLRHALLSGYQDFKEGRMDAAYLCIFYPLAGLVLSRLVLGGGLLPLLFPLVAGFALVSPLLATGLYQMSMSREQTGLANWGDAFAVFRSPALGSILLLGLWLVVIYMLWLGTAALLYSATFGPILPASFQVFVHDLLLTRHGWMLIVFGIDAGAVFAGLVLAIGLVSFPLLLDRNVGVRVAVATSVRAARENVGVVVAWGGIVAGLLVIGSLPFLIGLVVVFPVLGHATWHLYRRLIAPV